MQIQEVQRALSELMDKLNFMSKGRNIFDFVAKFMRVKHTLF